MMGRENPCPQGDYTQASEQILWEQPQKSPWGPLIKRGKSPVTPAQQGPWVPGQHSRCCERSAFCPSSPR